MRPPSEDEVDLRAAVEEAAWNEGVVLAPEQLERWATTGEWPWETQDRSG